MERGECRKCGAPLLWGRTKAGKPVPLDPEEFRGIRIPNTAGALAAATNEGRKVVVGYTESGEVATVQGAGAEEGGTWVSVRRTHFATCPNAGEFRRR